MGRATALLFCRASSDTISAGKEAANMPKRAKYLRGEDNQFEGLIVSDP
jgi:hypothetical protein